MSNLSWRRVQRKWPRARYLLLILLSALLLINIIFGVLVWRSFPLLAAAGHNPDGVLRIEVLTAYNLVVDSNVSSPSTYAPTAFSAGAKFCNDGAEDLLDVTAYIGEYQGGGPATGTPGLYRPRYPGDESNFLEQHPHLVKDAPHDSGTYQLQHEGGSAGTADATRYLGTIPAGECRAQYWLISYPQCENNNDGTMRQPPCGPDLSPVWGRANDPGDDLWLNYDVWVTAAGGLQAHEHRRVTMRNEISAMANKIWPNGDNKVPDVYKSAIDDFLGWNTTTPSGSNVVYAGEKVITTQGIWYDLGNVRQGFDNNGDLVPDYNAWLQPIGDPATFDPGCFRLLRSYGLLIVKRQGGAETLIPFEDQLYFENLPPDNTGVVGLVYYQYMALNGACTAGLSPYQEVASGRDNEKFNADYGTGIPPLASQALPSGTITKTAVPVAGLVVPGGTIDYTIGFSNPTAVSLGAPEFGLPIVIHDSIPAGASYVGGTAASGNSLPAGVTAYAIRYSTDGGVSWTASEPAPATTVTDIQWWLNHELAPGAAGTVTFQVTGQSGGVISNTAGIGLGNANPFATAEAFTLAAGSNSIGNFVWHDLNNNGQQDGGNETGIAGVTVRLYWDTNGNGEVDDNDLLIATTSTGACPDTSTCGIYTFSGLPNGDYLVVVDSASPNISSGYRYTTPIIHPVTLGGSSYHDADFGFGPSLRVEKTLLSNPAYEARTVSYAINVTNLRPASGEKVGNSCVYKFWSTTGSTASPPKNFTNFASAFGEPDNSYATGDFAIGSNRWIRGTGFDTGNLGGLITGVEALFPLYLSATLADDSIQTILYQGATQLGSTGTFNKAYLDGYVGQANARYAVWDISDGAFAPGGTWNFADFSSLTLHLEPNKSGGADNSVIYLDAMGFRVTVDGACPAVDANDIMTTVPLTDTYDITYLQFLSAEPPATTVDAGLIGWDNVGPIAPGETKSVIVRFRALDIGTTPVTISNSAGVTAARFADGGFANDDSDTAVGQIIPTGTINGYVYSDPNGTGWNYNPGAGDLPIPGVKVTIYGCYNTSDGEPRPEQNQPCTHNTSGEWRPVSTQVTDVNGYYAFTGLLNAAYYVQVTSSDLPGTVVQTAEGHDSQSVTGALPNTIATGRTCGGACDHTWGDPTDKLDNKSFNRIDSPGETINGVNFGYSINPGVYGSVWEDVNGDGQKDSGEAPIVSVTVRLYANSACSGAPALTTTTDAGGRYQFGNLAAPTTYCIEVNTASLPALPTGDSWAQTGESDGSIDNGITFTAVAGTLSGSHDFGFQKTGSKSLSGTVYADWNGNADQDGNEPSFSGIPVALYAGSGALITTTLTGADGSYTFPNLPDAQYTIVVGEDNLPAGYSQTEDPDSNIDGQHTLTISGVSVSGLDFGYQPAGVGAIGDTVWRDLNGNGIQDGVSETGIPNMTVWLEVDQNSDSSWARVRGQIAGVNGRYLFANLPDGTHRVVVDENDPDRPQGPGGLYVPSTPTTTGPITISNGSSYLDADFGFKPPATIGDMVYYDANANGEQDWNEQGISGVQVRLYNETGQTVTIGGVPVAPGAYITTVTSDGSDGNPAGWYQFFGLETGSAGVPFTYTVQVVTATLPGGGLPQTADPDRDGIPCHDSTTYPGLPACDNESTVHVYPGTNVMGADFGYRPPGAIGDFVWLDFNGDGIQDANEVGLPGVVVTVTNGSNTFTTTTDFDGRYSFANLSDGTWSVTFATPAGMESVGGGQSVGTSTSVGIAGGVVTAIGGAGCTACDLNVDSAFRYSGSTALSGTICLDDPADPTGQCGPGDSGVGPGQTALSDLFVYVYLWESGSPLGNAELIGITATAENGDYSFSNLPLAAANERYLVSTAAPFSNLALTSDNPAYNPFVTDIVAVTQPSGSGSGEHDLVGAYQVIDPGGAGAISNVDFAYSSNVPLDFGDLPDTYNTLLRSNGARHLIVSNQAQRIYLGQVLTARADGTPDDFADAHPSDDGVRLPENVDWSAEYTGAVEVTVTGSGYLSAWIDWYGNGHFNGAGARILVDYPVISGTQTITFTVPDGAGFNVFARFRLYPSSTNGLAAPEGLVVNGEVEDYYWTEDQTTPVSLAYFRAKRQGHDVHFEWTTIAEIGNVGFSLYVLTEGGRQKVNDDLILSPVGDSLEPVDYEYVAPNLSGNTFYIQDVDILGDVEWHGPFTIGRPYGARPLLDPIDWDAIQAEHEAKEAQRRGGWRQQEHPPVNLLVRGDGIYRASYESLRAAGLDLAGVPANHILVTNRGQSVPLYLNKQGAFGPGSFIEFYGQGLDTLYTDTNVYRLEVAQGSGHRMPIDRTPIDRHAQPPQFYMETAAVENNRLYSVSPPGNDPWFDTRLVAVTQPVHGNFEVKVDNLVAGAAPANLFVNLWGASIQPQYPDHHVMLHLNGELVANEWFDGLVEHPVTAELPAGLLQEGSNLLRLTLPGDTGAKWDIVILDQYAVTYPRGFVARQDRLHFTAAGGVFRVDSLSSNNVVVYRLQGSGPVRLERLQVQPVNGTYSVSFAGTNEGATYLISTVEELQEPIIAPARSITDITSGSAQYLMIAHPNFLEGLAPLVEFHQARGLEVRVVDVEEVYTQFNHGIFDPQAIRDYIIYAAHNMGTEYVLLVGGDNYDYRNYQGHGGRSFIPSLYALTGSIARFVPVDPLYADVTGNGLPDLPIGRFPVRTNVELASIIDKTLAYSANDYTYTAVFAADKLDPKVSFTAVSETFIRSLGGNWNVQRAHVDELPVSAARSVLLTAMNQGVALTSFVGHSNMLRWTFDGLFSSQDASSLTNAGRPTVVLQWGCWNTYHVQPQYNTLGHAFLLSGDRGAAAVLGSSSLTLSSSEEALGRRLIPKIAQPGMTLGKAIQAAKEELAATQPHRLDVLLGWTLLGDPALVVTPER
jgi:hypothetical protein